MTLNEREKEIELFNAFVKKELPELFEKHSNSNYFAKVTYDSMFGAWLGAKSQAVPDGYVVVPAELYNFQANHLAEEELKQNKSLFDMEHRGLSGIEMELRQAKWLVYKAERIKENYRRLVKWASESGAEG